MTGPVAVQVRSGRTIRRTTRLFRAAWPLFAGLFFGTAAIQLLLLIFTDGGRADFQSLCLGMLYLLVISRNRDVDELLDAIGDVAVAHRERGAL